jgi:hypothetical protein
MAGRKVRTAAEAAALLEEANANGVERAAWARRHGIDGRSLNAWRVNLARRRPEPRLELVELVPRGRESASLVVRCGPFSVEVGDGFDDEALRRVLRVMAAC